jgi:hypothetical protein
MKYSQFSFSKFTWWEFAWITVQAAVENNNRNVTENANKNKLKMTFKEALMTGSKSTVRNRPLSKYTEIESKKEDKRETN